MAPPPPADPASTDVSLAAGETDIDLGAVKVHTWAYGNRVPAQEIRLRKGQRLRAELTNAMPQDVTVHWHGIAIVNDMDGVPDLTQAALPNGQKFTYDFVVPDAGFRHGQSGKWITHCHNTYHLEAGMATFIYY